MYERWGPDWHIITAGWYKQTTAYLQQPKKKKPKFEDGRWRRRSAIYRIIDTKTGEVIISAAMQWEVNDILRDRYGIAVKQSLKRYHDSRSKILRRFAVEIVQSGQCDSQTD